MRSIQILQIKTSLSNVLHLQYTALNFHTEPQGVVREPRNRLITGAVCSYTTHDTAVFCSSAAIRMASPWDVKSCGLKHEQERAWGQDKRREEKVKKTPLSSPKGCKLAASCPHQRQNRKKGGWTERHTKEDRSYIPFTHMHEQEGRSSSHPTSPVCLHGRQPHLNHSATLL